METKLPITTRLPPRCPSPAAWTETQTPAVVAASPSRRPVSDVEPVTTPSCARIRTTAGSESVPTQSASPPKLMAVGPPGTETVAPTARVAGSSRETVPSMALSTHTAPPPYAIPVGPRPTALVELTSLVAGSTAKIRSADSSVTQTEPLPTTIPRPTAFVWIVATTLPDTSSMRLSVRSSLLVTHTEPYPAASATGPAPTPMVWTTAFV